MNKVRLVRATPLPYASAMKIAYTIAPGRGQTNMLLWDVAAALQARGLKLCGTVQTDTECDTSGRCDMDVRILPNGPVVRISQSLGAGSRGCRLDPQALEQSVAIAEAQLEAGAEAMIINKFGKQEAEGRGFRGTIAKALERDIPVIVGVNGANEAAFQEFCGGMAERLEPDEADILAWVSGT